MSSVRIRWIRCSSLVVSRSQLLMMLPSLSRARHQSPWAFWVYILLMSMAVGGVCWIVGRVIVVVEIGDDEVSSSVSSLVSLSSISVELSSVVSSRASSWEREGSSIELVKSSLEKELQRVGSHWVIGSKSCWVVGVCMGEMCGGRGSRRSRRWASDCHRQVPRRRRRKYGVVH